MANKIILTGNVGKDPEMHTFADGNVQATFSLATTERWKDRQTGEKKEKTEWHTVVARGKVADLVQTYVKKGSKLYVEGKLQYRKWEDQNGGKHEKAEVHLVQMEFLGDSNRRANEEPSAPSLDDGADIPF